MTNPSDVTPADEAPRSPGVPGLTRNDDAVIVGDAPDEAVSEDDDADPLAPFDAEDAPLAVTDDDTIGVDDQDDGEREQGATEV